MKSLLFSLCVAVAGTSLTAAPFDAEAKRLGGGRPAGMQRQMPAQPAQAVPAKPGAPAQNQQATPATPATPAPAAAPRRSWLGPLAGIAAGLGLAALFSHLGMGAAFGEFITLALLALVGFMVVRWVMRRMSNTPAAQPARNPMAGPQWATAAATAAPAPTSSVAPSVAHRDALNLPPLQPVMRTADGLGSPSQFGVDTLRSHTAPQELPEGFDVAAFERLAKMVFIRLQAANDTGAVDDLRKFTTPELFASLRLDLQDRAGAEQHTDVVELDAKLVDTARENDHWVASVRFRGLIREERGAEPAPFDELWHLVRPLDAKAEAAQQWAIAGITPQG